MKTEITTRHFELSDGLKQRTEERLTKLQRYFDRILDARVVVSLEKNRYDAEATLVANGTFLSSHYVGESEKAALEQVLDKLESQLRRHKDRLTRNKRRGKHNDPAVMIEIEDHSEEVESGISQGFDETDLEGLVREEPGDFSIAMSVAEAAAELKVSRKESLAFTNDATQRPALVFKRRDGNVSVVDIQLV